MRKHIKHVVIFLCIIYVLGGCRSSNTAGLNQNEEINVDIQYQIKKLPYTVYMQKEIELSSYEPEKGAYLGAYVLSNPEIDFDITNFEEAVGKNMATSIRHYQLGKKFPDQWLLQCLSQSKAPYIVIEPDRVQTPYNVDLLQQVAQQFENTYNMPLFLEFYPNPKEFGNPTEYIAYFQLAKEIFLQYAPNAVFVWSVDMEDLYDSMLYYPGDDYVDWVGMSMYFPIYKNNDPYVINVTERLDYFYNIYQSKKPMMISKLAVSHYSKKGHTFYIEEASNLIQYIYSEIAQNYPRIKGINYVDIDNIKVAPNNIGNDNFTVSTEPKMTRAYKEAILNPHYLQHVEESQKHKTFEWIKMRMPMYECDNKLYVVEEMLKYDWGLNVIEHLKDCKEVIDGKEYYKLDDLVKKMNYKYKLKNDIIRIYPKQ